MLLLFYIASFNARAYFNVRDNVKRDMQTVYENLYYELQLTRSAKRDWSITASSTGIESFDSRAIRSATRLASFKVVPFVVSTHAQRKARPAAISGYPACPSFNSRAVQSATACNIFIVIISSFPASRAKSLSAASYSAGFAV